MLTSTRSLIAATLLAGTVFAAAPAMAQDATSSITLTGNASIVSQYRFRGVDLSGGDIAVQGGIDASHSSGFYVGTWGSSLDEDTVGYGHTELDLYGGWAGDVASGVNANVGVIRYVYPNAGAGNFDYTELYGKLGFGIGPATATVGVAYAPKQDSLGSTDNLYLYTDVGVAIPSTPVTLTAHLGYTDGFLTYTPDGTAFDYSVGAKVAINQKLSASLSYVAADGHSAPYNFVNDAVVATLGVSF
ncbi:MAG: hypothetical protein RLZZ08_811 [Pseudomonadota bacterium]|jgi:uncharacterized protein (TIGR02001 family)